MKHEKLVSKPINTELEQNIARARLGLPIIKKKRRCCLACDETFTSTYEERICPSCKEKHKQMEVR